MDTIGITHRKASRKTTENTDLDLNCWQENAQNLQHFSGCDEAIATVRFWDPSWWKLLLQFSSAGSWSLFLLHPGLHGKNGSSLCWCNTGKRSAISKAIMRWETHLVPSQSHGPRMHLWAVWKQADSWINCLKAGASPGAPRSRNSQTRFKSAFPSRKAIICLSAFLPISPQMALLTLTPSPFFPPFLSLVTLWERLCSSHLPRALALTGAGTHS